MIIIEEFNNSIRTLNNLYSLADLHMGEMIQKDVLLILRNDQTKALIAEIERNPTCEKSHSSV